MIRIISSALAFAGAIGMESPASAQADFPNGEELSSASIFMGDTSCVFETASFIDRIIKGAPQDMLEDDVMSELKEAFGADLPEGDVDFAEMTYSMCGSSTENIENFDRVDVYRFLNEPGFLAPSAVEAFQQAWELLSTKPCDQDNIAWIVATVDGSSEDSVSKYCPENN